MAGLRSRIIFCGIALAVLLAVAAAAQNHPPVLSSIGSKEVVFGSTLSFSLSASDPDNNKITFSGANLPSNSTLDPDTGLFSWTPAVNQLGEYPFAFTATDNGKPSLSDSQTVNCTVVFRTVRSEKAWGFGLKNEETVVETTSVADLCPRITKIEVNGQPYASSQTILYTSGNPTVKIEAASPFNIEKNKISVLLDGKEIEISSFSNIQTFGEQKNILSLAFEINPKNLSLGEHALAFKVGNVVGITTQGIIVNVVGLRLVGAPLSFPSPYNPAAGVPVTLQYTLTQSADIDIYIFGSSLQILKKLSAFKDGEGGRAGLNKIAWDGRTDFGTIISNGIYLATIVNREDQKVLGKIKIVVY